MFKHFRQLLLQFSFRKYAKNYLYRIIWFGCISVCIPVILIGGVYYQLSKSAALNELEKVSESSLGLSEERLERIFQGIELSSLQLIADPLISNSFLDGDSKEKILVHLDILKLIQVAKSTNDFIDEIILYNDASEDILNYEHGFAFKKMYKYKNVIDQIMQMEQKDQCLNMSQPGEQSFLTCIRFLSPAGSNKAKGLLIIKLNQRLIQTYLEGPTVYNAKQSILVLDSSHQVLAQVGEYFAKEQSLPNQPSIQTIIHSDSGEGHLFANDSQGNRYYYSYLKSKFGRTYISKTSEEDISEHVTWIRWVIVFTILLFVNIGIFLTVITSLKVYNPIRQLVNLGKKLNQGAGREVQSINDITFIQQCWTYLNEESLKINKYLQKWEPTVKESFLLQLLERGSLNQELKDVHSGVISLIKEQRVFVVLAINVEDMYKETRFNHNDGPIVAFIIKNVFSELLYKQEQLTGEVVTDRNGLGVGVISCRVEMTETDMINKVKELAYELIQAFHAFLKLKVCIGIGRLHQHLDDVAISYREALEALEYRMYQDHSAILYIEELESAKKHNSFYYPITIEEILIQHLENREFQEAEFSLNEYMKVVLSSESYQVISQCYSMLLVSILRSLIKLGYSQIFEHNLIASFQQRKTSSEVYNWFAQHIFPLYKQVLDRSGSTNLLVKKVCQYINEHVHQDISLSQCADLVKISPSHLSKLFKKQTGMNFLDYVLDRKLKHAQELLLSTNLSPQEIADQIGYSERSLIRIFQKYVHMSPIQYRLTKTNQGE